MAAVVGVSVQTQHVIPDEALVGEWLQPVVQTVIEAAGVVCDAKVIADACSMKFCFMIKTKALRQRLQDQPAVYGARMVALATLILGDGAAEEQVADLAAAIRTEADDLLVANTLVEQ